jgi:nucleotide-binding universal stress UspA family protein
MFKQILVPVDGSELAEHAFPVAEAIARAGGATVHLVRVIQPLAVPWTSYDTLDTLVPDPVIELNYTEIAAEQTTAATAYLDAARSRFEAAGLTVRTASPLDNAASGLLDYERASGIDLVVICTHGYTGLTRFALGSVAEHLLRHGRAPVLLVRAAETPIILDHALVPLDGSPLAEQALREVHKLTSQILKSVTLLRVIGNEREREMAERYLAGVAERLRQEQIACGLEVVVGDPTQAILDAAGADTLIIMATHDRSGLARWALGSVTDKVTHGGASAVLAVRSDTSGPAAQVTEQ